MKAYFIFEVYGDGIANDPDWRPEPYEIHRTRHAAEARLESLNTFTTEDGSDSQYIEVYEMEELEISSQAYFQVSQRLERMKSKETEAKS